jgi:hypothetical protein
MSPELIASLGLSLGAAWGSGFRLYATIFFLGLMGATGALDLPEHLELLQTPLILTVSGSLCLVEFVADKVPWFDSIWDSIQTFVRIPAGAILAAQLFGSDEPAAQVAVGLIGGGLTTATHAAKAGTRMMINTSPEPVSNWISSIGEDLALVAGLWVALNHPWIFLTGIVVFLLFLAWLLPKVWRGVRALFRWMTTSWHSAPPPGETPPGNIPGSH